MKKPRIVAAMEYIDEDIITETIIYKPHKNKFPVWAKWMVAAACFCLCIIGAFKIWNPGMGCSQQVRDFLESDGTLYFSTWDNGAYCWNIHMDKPQKLSETGRFSKSDSGIILYSIQENKIWEVKDNLLTTLGKANVGEILENPLLIGIYDDYVYWGGEQKDLAEFTSGNTIIRTSLSDEQSEEIDKISDGLYLNCHIRGNILYYHLEEFKNSKEKICARNLTTGEETVFKEFVKGDAVHSLKVYFMENDIVISDQEENKLYRMDYTGGDLILLTDYIPQTQALSEQDGKIYYITSFGENTSYEFLSGNGFYSENMVSVDLKTGELEKITDFDLENDNGTVKYTLIELAMTKDGFYFLDPNAGVMYHNYISHNETEIYRSK